MEDWNSIFIKYGSRTPKYDDWLDKFLPDLEISRGQDIIDLGCGSGNDTLYLTERGFSVISCDYSIEALKRLTHFIRNPQTRHFDIRERFPFDDSSVSVIISDLSIHYFSKKETERIAEELSRVLVSGGFLLCRINSTKDVNHGAGQGEKIEDNFYNYEGTLKRFFDRNEIDYFFSRWKIDYINECEMLRYKQKKIVWEFKAVNSSK
jgi:SAM-dependent methyltransferase